MNHKNAFDFRWVSIDSTTFDAKLSQEINIELFLYQMRRWRYLPAFLCLLADTSSSFHIGNNACLKKYISSRSSHRELTMYMPSQSSTPPMRSIVDLQLSPSVVSSCDALPSFHPAHGLLSPETVMQLDKMTAKRGRSKAIDIFFTTYRREGPMSCLEMLSDPDILPELTSAMRDLLH